MDTPPTADITRRGFFGMLLSGAVAVLAWPVKKAQPWWLKADGDDTPLKEGTLGPDSELVMGVDLAKGDDLVNVQVTDTKTGRVVVNISGFTGNGRALAKRMAELMKDVT